MSSEIVLSASGISKSYKSELSESRLQVLEDVSLTINKGVITSIVGSSGSGKSTLLHILGGLDKADKGEVIWKGRSLSEFNSDQLADFRDLEGAPGKK